MLHILFKYISFESVSVSKDHATCFLSFQEDRKVCLRENVFSKVYNFSSVKYVFRRPEAGFQVGFRTNLAPFQN